jgi:hypothetical protein
MVHNGLMDNAHALADITEFSILTSAGTTMRLVRNRKGWDTFGHTGKHIAERGTDGQMWLLRELHTVTNEVVAR